MKTNILFIHSAGPQEEGVGSSFLIQHLKNQLETDYPLHFPKMPYPESPEYDQWKTRFEEFIMTLSGSALLIGHSIGGSFLIKYLSEASEPLPIKIEALFIMAAPYWGIDEDWQLKDFFLADDFASNLPQDMPIYLYHSIDEATVPFKHINCTLKNCRRRPSESSMETPIFLKWVCRNWLRTFKQLRKDQKNDGKDTSHAKK